MPFVSADSSICSQVAPLYCKIEETKEAQFDPFSVLSGFRLVDGLVRYRSCSLNEELFEIVPCFEWL